MISLEINPQSFPFLVSILTVFDFVARGLFEVILGLVSRYSTFKLWAFVLLLECFSLSRLNSRLLKNLVATLDVLLNFKVKIDKRTGNRRAFFHNIPSIRSK